MRSELHLEWTLRSTNINFFVFLDGFEALMECGEDNLMFEDPGPFEQQMIRGTSIYSMKISNCSHRPNSQLKIDVARVKTHCL